MVLQNKFYKVICITNITNVECFIFTNKMLTVWRRFLKKAQAQITKIDKKTTCAYIAGNMYIWYTCAERPRFKDKVFIKYIEDLVCYDGYEL